MGILLTAQSDHAVHEIPETTDSLWVNGVPALQLAKKPATLSNNPLVIRSTTPGKVPVASDHKSLI
jgi:hypothetical protein